MSLQHSPKIVTDGLVLALDAANSKSYVNGSTTWNDLSGNNNTLYISPSTQFSSLYRGELQSGFDITGSVTPTTAISGTISFWTRTTDSQGVYFMSQNAAANYVGAYNNGPYYSSNAGGSNLYYINTAITSTPMNNIDDKYFYAEIKNINFSNWVGFRVASYGSSFTYNGFIAAIYVYNRVLSQNESLQNFNATRGRFGV
jgi:hypothetical protein